MNYIYSNKKFYLLILLFFLLKINAFGQQDPMYGQYIHVPLAINPAYAGSSGVLSAQFLGREQWVGLHGAPKTKLLTVHAPVNSYNLGVGGVYINDKYGPVNLNSYFLNASYTLNMSRSSLAFGLSAGVDRLDIDLLGLNVHDKGDEYFAANYSSNNKLNYGLGFYYYSDRFFAGLAIPRLIENSRNFSYNRRHYFVSAGYLFDLSRDLKLQPSVFTGFVKNAPILLTAHVDLIYQDKLWFGVKYRYPDAIGLSLAYQLSEQFRVGYAYDFNFWQREYNINGSHEIFISFDMRFNKSKVMTPRYF